MNQIQSSKNLIETIYEKKTVLLGVLVVIAVAASGYYGWTFIKAKNEQKAMDAYSLGEKLYQAGLGAADFANKNSDPKAPKTQVDQSQALVHFEKVAKEYPNSSAHYLAALRMSEIYMQKNEIEKTIAALEPIVEKGSFKNMTVSLVGLRLSNIYERTQKCDKAIPVLEKLVSAQTSNLIKPEAYLRLGLCHEALNQKDKAADFYKKLTQEFADSIQAQQAQKYLKIINS